MNHVAVYFPSGARVFAELVTSRTDIERGLMHQPHVPDGTGMLFDMGHVAPHRFWMKDTLVPLDMVFISPRGVVVGIVYRAVPHDITLRGVRRRLGTCSRSLAGGARVTGWRPGRW